MALTTGTIVATDCIDLSFARDVGGGEPLQLVLTIDATFSGGMSITPQIITGTGVSSTINAGVQVLVSGPAIPASDLRAGAVFVVPLPPFKPQGNARYLGAQFVISGTFGGGSISACLVRDAQHLNKQYASGWSLT